MMANITEKLKTVAVKCNPPRRSRAEIIEKCNVGFVPKYQTSNRAIGQSLAERKASLRRYSDNWDKAFGKKE